MKWATWLPCQCRIGHFSCSSWLHAPKRANGISTRWIFQGHQQRAALWDKLNNTVRQIVSRTSICLLTEAVVKGVVNVSRNSKNSWNMFLVAASHQNIVVHSFTMSLGAVEKWWPPNAWGGHCSNVANKSQTVVCFHTWTDFFSRVLTTQNLRGTHHWTFSTLKHWMTNNCVQQSQWVFDWKCLMLLMLQSHSVCLLRRKKKHGFVWMSKKMMSFPLFLKCLGVFHWWQPNNDGIILAMLKMSFLNCCRQWKKEQRNQTCLFDLLSNTDHRMRSDKISNFFLQKTEPVSMGKISLCIQQESFHHWQAGSDFEFSKKMDQPGQMSTMTNVPLAVLSHSIDFSPSFSNIS